LKLDIKKDTKGMVMVENVTLVTISTFEELEAIVCKGIERRHTSGTQMKSQTAEKQLLHALHQSCSLRILAERFLSYLGKKPLGGIEL